jgi:hypothetical protein
MKRLSFLILLSLILFNSAEAQLFGHNPKEINDVLNKKLLVVTDIESANYLSMYEEKLGGAKDNKKEYYEENIAMLKEKASFYNEHILEFVNKHWQHGDKSEIKFIDGNELNKIKKSSSAKDYAILYPITMRKIQPGVTVYQKKEIRSLALQPLLDYLNATGLFLAAPIISSGLPEMTEFELELSVKLLNQLIGDAANSTAKKVNFSNCIEESIAANCGQLGSKTLNISQNLISKKTNNIQAAFSGVLKVLDDKSLEEACRITSDELIAVVYPITISSADPYAQKGMPQTQSIMLIVLSVEPSTGKVYGMTKPLTVEKISALSLSDKEITQLGKCGVKK